ncbi:MAG TPA: hypothetical protein VLH19_00870, partial [Patescibacteria group bacterium]|nr:hypothetical protein [Patescibacteria group bacterium]
MKKFAVFCLLSLALFLPQGVFAYTTNMSASVVIGQPDFTSSSTGLTASTLNLGIGSLASDGRRLIVADASNNRVLIWNTIPTTNGVAADVVVGQADFTSGSVNQGGSTGPNTLNNPFGVETDGTRLFIADKSNARVLIFNRIPTSNNASADLVIGQTDFTTTTAAISQTKLTFPSNISYDSASGKLLILDQLSNSTNGGGRILIYNTVPNTNGAAADVVVGQPDFTSGSAVCSAATASTICPQIGKVRILDRKLVLPDFNNNRVLIWNSVPTVNGASADVVIGQPNMTSGAINQGGSIAANNMRGPVDALFDGRRLFISDSVNDSRVLIYNSGIPSSNNATADVVIGQPNLTSVGTNQGGNAAANTLSRPRTMALVDNKLIVSDSGANNRILIYTNLVRGPGLSLAGSPTRQYDNIFRQFGTAISDPLYVIHSVEYSVNGGSFSSAVPTDGTFDGTREDFHLDFDPSSGGTM